MDEIKYITNFVLFCCVVVQLCRDAASSTTIRVAIIVCISIYRYTHTHVSRMKYIHVIARFCILVF